MNIWLLLQMAKELQCRRCDHVGDRVSMATHVGILHAKQNQVPFFCGECFRRFARRDLIDRHLKKNHPKESPEELRKGTMRPYQLQADDYYPVRRPSGEKRKLDESETEPDEGLSIDVNEPTVPRALRALPFSPELEVTSGSSTGGDETPTTETPPAVTKTLTVVIPKMSKQPSNPHKKDKKRKREETKPDEGQNIDAMMEDVTITQALSPLPLSPEPEEVASGRTNSGDATPTKPAPPTVTKKLTVVVPRVPDQPANQRPATRGKAITLKRGHTTKTRPPAAITVVDKSILKKPTPSDEQQETDGTHDALLRAADLNNNKKVATRDVGTNTEVQTTEQGTNTDKVVLEQKGTNTDGSEGDITPYITPDSSRSSPPTTSAPPAPMPKAQSSTSTPPASMPNAQPSTSAPPVPRPATNSKSTQNTAALSEEIALNHLSKEVQVFHRTNSKLDSTYTQLREDIQAGNNNTAPLASLLRSLLNETAEAKSQRGTANGHLETIVTQLGVLVNKLDGRKSARDGSSSSSSSSSSPASSRDSSPDERARPWRPEGRAQPLAQENQPPASHNDVPAQTPRTEGRRSTSRDTTRVADQRSVSPDRGVRQQLFAVRQAQRQPSGLRDREVGRAPRHPINDRRGFEQPPGRRTQDRRSYQQPRQDPYR